MHFRPHISEKNGIPMMFIMVVLSALLISLLFLLVISSTGEAVEPYEVRVRISSGYTNDLAGSPGDRLKFYLDIENVGTEEDTYNISASDSDWRVTLSQTRLDLNDGDEETIIVSVDIPEWANASEYVDITITATSQDAPGNVSDSELITAECEVVYGAEFVTGDSGTAEPGDNLSMLITVRNTGDSESTITLFNPDLPDGWTHYWPTNRTHLLQSHSSIDIAINILISDDPQLAPPGNHSVQIFGTYDTESDPEPLNGSSFLNITIRQVFAVDIWSDVPGKHEILKENDPIEMSYGVTIRNLGNSEDDIYVAVPNDEFSGEKKDWVAKFGTQSSKTLTLDPSAQQSLTLTLTIDKNTDPGNYTLRVRAESQGDTAEARYAILYVNLTKAQYGVQLEKITQWTPDVNPADEAEIEFRFALTNTGNQDDTYTIEVETPLGSGIYKGWIMEFEDDAGSRVEEIRVPSELPGNSDYVLAKNDHVDVTLYVIVAVDEDAGNYSDISLSVTSDNDNAKVAYLYFNLTVILPNIRLSDDVDDFWIDPDSEIVEDDDIDIHLNVYNDGGAESGTFYVWFYNGKRSSGNEVGGWTSSGLIGWEKIDNIPVGSYYELVITWEEIPAGENDIYAYADKPIKSGDGKTLIDNTFSSDGLVLESRENDNTASIANIYQDAIDLRPNLEVLYVNFGDRVAGRTTTVSVRIANIGSATAQAGTGQVSLKIDGTSIKADTPQFKGINPFLPEDIAPGDSIEIAFTWDIPDDPGNKVVKVVVDHDDDSNSTNDRYTTYVIVITEIGDGIEDFDLSDYWWVLFAGFIACIFIGLVLLDRMNPSKPPQE